jgi:hypothetical protein
MASIDLLIPELDRKLRSLHQEQSLVIKTGKTGMLEQPLLPEYLRLTMTDGIVPGVEFIALDALSKHFNLYEDERERQQILAAMADELNDSTASDILASIQIIQNDYPSIYQLAKEQLILTRGRAEPKPEVLPPVNAKDSPTILPPSPPVTSKEPQSKSGLIVGFCIVSAILGGAIANSFNKSPIAVSPTSVNNPQPNSTGIQTSSVGINNPISSSTAVKEQTRPSPAQAIRDHYQALNARNYDLTWSNLSSRFKVASGNSSTLARKEYEDWWNSVRSIDLQRSETASISSDGSKAVVNYRHGYIMNSGRFVQDKHTRLFLVWDIERGKWLIDRRI